MFESRCTYREIANRMGLSYHQLAGKVSYMKRRGENDLTAGLDRPIYTADEEETIRVMVAANYSFSEIGSRLGRTRRAVTLKITEMRAKGGIPREAGRSQGVQAHEDPRPAEYAGN